MGQATKAGGVQWVAVCDAWDVQRDRAEKVAGVSVDKYVDYRKLLDRKDMDAVIICNISYKEHRHVSWRKEWDL